LREADETENDRARGRSNMVPDADSTKRTISTRIPRSCSIFARRLIDTVLESNMWQFKNVRGFPTWDGRFALSVIMERRNIDSLLETRSGTQLFIVIIVVLNVHDTFAGPFKRTTTPSANTFVHSLIHMSNAHIGNDRGGHTARKVPTPMTMIIQLTCSTRSRPVLPRPPPPIRK
jgi:hypothetical protein